MINNLQEFEQKLEELNEVLNKVDGVVNFEALSKLQQQEETLKKELFSYWYRHIEKEERYWQQQNQ